MNETISIKSLEARLRQLKFMKDMKKDYYKSFPRVQVYREICELISQISYLECKIKN
jgi:hypothetical protein